MANVDGNAQASLFLNSIKGARLNMPHILDWEDGSVQGQPISVQVTRALTILQVMENASGVMPWIYMGLDLAQQLQLPSVFAKYPIILASYNPNLGDIPIPWLKATAWQYTDSAEIDGVSPGHTVDANWFLGSIGQLQDFCKT